MKNSLHLTSVLPECLCIWCTNAHTDLRLQSERNIFKQKMERCTSMGYTFFADAFFVIQHNLVGLMFIYWRNIGDHTTDITL